MAEVITWQQAEKIRDLTEIDEVIFVFSQDSTGDNATGMIIEIIKAWEKQNGRNPQE